MKTPYSKKLCDWIGECGLRPLFTYEGDQSEVEQELHSYRRAIETSQIVLADNLAAPDTSAQTRDELRRAFPVLTPPFGISFIEGCLDSAGSRWGCIVTDAPSGEWPINASGSARDIIFIPVIGRSNEKGIVPRPIFTIGLDEDGAASSDLNLYDPNPGSLPSGALGLLFLQVAKTMHCISLFHCRNVSAVDVRPPTALNRTRLRKGKPALLTHKVLDVRPMRQSSGQNPSHQPSQTTGPGVALHIARGHFKDYRKGKGLFGRTPGLFWWDAGERGSADLGTIEKTYQVHPPRAE